MFYTQWEILLVDDEPDVLSISKLAMQNFEVYGLPLKIHTAESKAQALEFLNGRPDRYFSYIAVAFIDVVMESDSAGLELCQEIREGMHNHQSQLFIRTGQPGIAPERAVIDRYDINGYFTKAEATEDKLYSLVKSGVRQFMSTSWLESAYFMVNSFVANADSREKLEEGMVQGSQQFDGLRLALDEGSGRENMLSNAVRLDNRLIYTGPTTDESTAAQHINRLNQLDGIPLGEAGGKYIRDDENHQMIKIAAQDTNPELIYYFLTTFRPPLNTITAFHSGLQSLAAVWQRAG